MSTYTISCCSTTDLSKAHLDSREIPYLFFHYSLDDVEYCDDFGESLPTAVLYEKMLAGAVPKTSQISIGEYQEFFRGILSTGKDLLHITMSSGISGSYRSAMMAAENIRAEFPERKLYIVDSLAGSSGYGMLMDKLADLRDDGFDIDALHDWVETHKFEMHHWFCASDLTFLIKGGRISKHAGLVGQMLNICPIMQLGHEGRITVSEKVRGRKKVAKNLIEKCSDLAHNGKAYADSLFIVHSDQQWAEDIAAQFREHFPAIKEIKIFPIGAAIGCHTGPGTIGVFFWGKPRTAKEA